MLREIHRYIWLSNWFMGRGLKKKEWQNDRMTDTHYVDFNIDVLNCVLLHLGPILFCTILDFPVFLTKFLYPTFLIFLKWSIIFISNRDLNAACRNRVLAIVPDLTAWLIVVGSVIEGEDFFGSVGRLLFHTRAGCAYRPLKLHCCKEEKKLTNNRYAIRFISIWFCLQGHRRWPLHCNLHCPILQKLHHVSHPCLEVLYARHNNPLLIWSHSQL